MILRGLDTSVAVAWYLPERYSVEARTWRTSLIEGRVRLIVPGLHYWELANVLRTFPPLCTSQFQNQAKPVVHLAHVFVVEALHSLREQCAVDAYQLRHIDDGGLR